MKRALVGLVALGLVAGCESKSSPHLDPPVAPSSAPPPVIAAPPDVPPPAASSVPATSGAIADLVAGKGAPAGLPEASTEPGRRFDVFLRRRITEATPPGAKIKMGGLKVTAGLPPEVVTRILRQAFGRIRACYDVALKRDPDLAGAQGFSLVIDKKGELTSVTAVAPSFPDKAVASCSVSTLKGMSFPEPEKAPVTVTFEMTYAVE